MFARSPSPLARTLALCALLAPSACDAGVEPEPEPEADTDEPSSPESPCTPGGGEPSLEIGQGETAYAPLGEGDTLELIHGPQGGVHVLVALQASYIDASEDLEATMIGTIDGEPLGASYPYLHMRCNEAAGGVQSWNTYLIWEADPADIHQKTAHIEVELTDASGLVLSASKDAVIHDPTL